MMDKKCVLGFCVMGLFCSMVFSENDILWDFGVVIRQPDYQNNPKDVSNQHSTNQKVFQAKINAVISDPFIPPVRNIFPPDISDPLVYKLSESLTELILKKKYLSNRINGKKILF